MSDVGGTIGDYRLESLIGSGRTGRVFRASHLRFDAVRMALRQFGSAVVDAPGFKGRFVEFAQAAAVLVHPQIVRVRESGDDDRRWFVAMDLMSGTLASRRPDATTAEWSPRAWALVDAMRQAAEGVAAAHAVNVAHGNVHLGNLFLSDERDGTLQVKVGDFGLTALAATGEAPSAADDLLALGRALYAITTGRDVPAAAATAEPPTRLVRGYPDVLDTIVARCISADPRDRFDSCDALASALREAVLAATSVSAGGGGASLHATITVAPSKQSPPPVPAPTIPEGSQAVPLVHVLDAAGNVVDQAYVRHSGLRVGRGEHNDFVLKSSAVSHEHARIDWVDNRVTVTDLGSTNNTQVQGVNLVPQWAQEWGREHWVQIGPYWLWLEHPPDHIDKAGIDIMLDQRSRTMTLTPGKPVTCRVTLSNQTKKIQHAELSVEGIPSEWVQGTRVRRELPRIEPRDMDLVITVPRSPDGLAQTYDVVVKVHCITTPTLAPTSVPAKWTVEAFEAPKLTMTPSKAGGVRGATYNATLVNGGNRAFTYVLAGSDSDRRLDYSVSCDGYPASTRLSVDVPPGEYLDARLHVAVPRRWFGSTTPQSFTLQASPIDGKQDSKVEAHFMHRAMFPVWALALAPVLIIGLIVLLPWLFKPEVRTVYLDPVNPAAGTPFSVNWDASRGTRVRVFVNEVPMADPDPDARSLTIPNGVPKDGQARVVVSNLFGEHEKSTPISLIDVEPDEPELDATIEPQNGIVAPGGEVRISWNATKAERVQFSHGGNLPRTHVFTDRPTESQTYVITAFNKGKTAVRTFKVEVRRIVNQSELVLKVESRDFKPGRPNLEINQGRSVFFAWSAPNASNVRLEGGGGALQLSGTSGIGRRAQLRGRGHYSFRLVATSETGDEVFSNAVEIDVTCTALQIATKRCNGTPEVRW